LARQKIAGLHLTFSYLKQIPVLAPATFEAAAPWFRSETVAQWITRRVIELTYTAWDAEPIAQDIGWLTPPFRWSETRRALLQAELDGCFFHLYDLKRDDVDYILSTFPIVNRKDVARFGEERTRRLVLERYDALADAAVRGRPYQTPLDPPPAHPSLTHPESTRPDWAGPPAETP
jgi:hypothetical protein